MPGAGIPTAIAQANMRLWGTDPFTFTACCGQNDRPGQTVKVAACPAGVYRVMLPISTGLGAGDPASMAVSVTMSSPWVMLPMRVALALAPAMLR